MPTTACPYAHALGVPGKGVHEARLFGLARNDVIATILVAIATSYFFRVPFWASLLGWFVLGELLHYAFGTQTAFLRAIGLAPDCSSQ